jgi:GxxExxY protein
MSINRQVAVPVVYRNTRIEAGLWMDMVVKGLVIVAAKAVEIILPIHKTLLLAYLKLSGLQLGLLINFNVTLIKNEEG